MILKNKMNKALEYRKILEKQNKPSSLKDAIDILMKKKEQENKIRELYFRKRLDDKHRRLFNCFIWD